jgi:hypothetical protein
VLFGKAFAKLFRKEEDKIINRLINTTMERVARKCGKLERVQKCRNGIGEKRR